SSRTAAPMPRLSGRRSLQGAEALQGAGLERHRGDREGRCGRLHVQRRGARSRAEITRDRTDRLGRRSGPDGISADPDQGTAVRLTGIFAVLLASAAGLAAADSKPTLVINSPMPAPEWARLERRLLAENVPACREFAQKYYDERGYVQCFVRWGANDGPDDAFENFVGWPELHALGASDEVLQIFLKTWNGMIRQYSEAKTIDVPAGRDGMYFKEYSAQADWMHHGEGLRTFNLMGLSTPT